MELSIPEEFDRILDMEHRAYIGAILSKYDKILSDNKLTFFPEFTNHGIDHINQVLQTAAYLISKESYQYLNSKDVTVLIASIVLHDIGMHLTPDGLEKMLTGGYDAWRINAFDKFSWSEIWMDFFQEAKRFNDDQRRDIFGDVNVEIEEPNLKTLDSYTIRIYGEFLRRNHHRLAHEIALGGFPSKIGEENILLPQELDVSIKDLSGLVARSHGINLRATFDYLESLFQDAWKNPFGIKVIYLMVVLRIADYIQIQSGRAPKVILKTKLLQSPKSRTEWEKHNSIKDINTRTDDPERIFVIADPVNNIIFLELERLFKDIQREFDLSWAVLGEAYGRDEEFNKLKIKFRRIRSNLDNKDIFSERVRYIPEKIVFDADPELLKLLIGPLYGEDPKYGIRELLQNSIDAIKEREYLLQNADQKQHYVGLVSFTIEIKDESVFLEIKDNGIGMTKYTLINYFFRAGASFRKSMAWKKNFVHEGKVKVIKTGRFGVGVLAAFLIGDEFELTTRYFSESQGYYCKAALNAKQIELLKKDDCLEGTMIRIKLKEEVAALIYNSKEPNENKGDIHWFDWYLMDIPKIEYNIPKEIRGRFLFLKERDAISGDPEGVSRGWYSFDHPDFRKIHWTISLDNNSYSRTSGVKLISNGFKIPRGYKIFDKSYKWSQPKLSIFDSNSKLPLSLSRDYILDDRISFESDLIEEVYKLVLIKLLNVEFERHGDFFVATPTIINFDNWNLDLARYVLIVDDKFTLLDEAIFRYLDFRHFYQIWISKKSRFDEFNKRSLISKKAYQVFKSESDSVVFYRNAINEGSEHHQWFSIGQSSWRHEHSKIYLKKEKTDYLFNDDRIRLPLNTKQNFNTSALNNKWSLIETRGELKSIANGVDINLLNEHTFKVLAERNIRNASMTKHDNGQLVVIWKKIIGDDFLIPIAKNQRPHI